MSLIPSLLHQGAHVSDSLSKAHVFNTFFLNQCNLDTSHAPNLPNPNPSAHILSNINITENDVVDTLNSLDVSKATGPDEIGPKLLKEAAPCIFKSLTKLFQLSLQMKSFPSEWKMANVTPIHKKGSASLCNNYRPISLLSCVGKVMERIVFKYTFNFLRDNLVISAHQSGFMPGDSTVNQLLLLYHELCLAIDEQKEVRVIFLDISKAFDKVWHDGLLYKMKKNGITGNLFYWFRDYLSNRKQRVVINGKSSDWGNINAGVPQGSVLGPLLFLIFINDIVDIVNSKIKLFADDTSLYLNVDHPFTAAATLNSDLSSIDDWSKQWLISFNAVKTDTMIITRKLEPPNHPPLTFQGHQLINVNSHKHLGLTFRSDLRWIEHVNNLTIKATRQLNILKSLQYKLDRKTLEVVYISFIRPVLEYASVVWDGCNQSQCNQLENIQLAAARVVTGAMKTTSIAKLYEEIGWETLAKRREIAKLIQMYKIIHNIGPDYLRNVFPHIPDANTRFSYNTRRKFDIPHFRVRTDLYDRSFFPSATRLWNSLPLDIRNITPLSQFVLKIKPDSSCPVQDYSLYNVGDRFMAIQHARLRMGSSQLHEHLYKIGVKDSPLCSCNQGIEDSWHYFFICTRYASYRNMLHTFVITHAPFTLQTLLYGSSTCCLAINKAIFLAVQKYISDTKRFNPSAIT